jgi:hypothetical protein
MLVLTYRILVGIFFKNNIMGASKGLFELMGMHEIEVSNFLPTKKEVQTSSKHFITNLLDKGESDKIELLAQAKRLSEALDVITAELLKVIPLENFEAYGLKGTYRSGGDTINYSEDPIYTHIKKELDDRAELLKLALKQDLIDAYGNDVPKVSTTPRKSSLAISY